MNLSAGMPTLTYSSNCLAFDTFGSNGSGGSMPPPICIAMGRRTGAGADELGAEVAWATVALGLVGDSLSPHAATAATAHEANSTVFVPTSSPAITNL